MRDDSTAQFEDFTALSEESHVDSHAALEVVSHLIEVEEDMAERVLEVVTTEGDQGAVETLAEMEKEVPGEEVAAIVEVLVAAAEPVFAPDPLQNREALETEAPLTPAQEAELAAYRARVEIRAAESHLDVAAAVTVLDAVFGSDQGHYYPPSLLRNIMAAGAPILLAWDGDTVLGSLLALPGWKETGYMVQSGPLAVVPEGRGRGIAVALKLAQRAWCLERGLPEVRWTYDVLVRANARLNLHTLRAEVLEFLPGFEGVRRPDADTALPNDRLLVRWKLTATPVPVTPPITEDHWAVWEEEGEVKTDPAWRGCAVALVDLPGDIQQLRREDPEAASKWQQSVGEVLKAAIEEQWYVDVDPRGCYRLVNPTHVTS